MAHSANSERLNGIPCDFVTIALISAARSLPTCCLPICASRNEVASGSSRPGKRKSMYCPEKALANSSTCSLPSRCRPERISRRLGGVRPRAFATARALSRNEAMSRSVCSSCGPRGCEASSNVSRMRSTGRPGHIVATASGSLSVQNDRRIPVCCSRAVRSSSVRGGTAPASMPHLIGLLSPARYWLRDRCSSACELKPLAEASVRVRKSSPATGRRVGVRMPPNTGCSSCSFHCAAIARPRRVGCCRTVLISR